MGVCLSIVCDVFAVVFDVQLLFWGFHVGFKACGCTAHLRSYPSTRVDTALSFTVSPRGVWPRLGRVCEGGARVYR